MEEEQHAEATKHGGGGHDPRRDREGQRHERADLPGEGGGERGGEEPHGEHGAAPRRGPWRRALEAAEGEEQQEQVEVREADEGEVVAAAAEAEAEAEREVEPEGDEDPHGGQGQAAAAGRCRRRRIRVGIRGGFRRIGGHGCGCSRWCSGRMRGVTL